MLLVLVLVLSLSGHPATFERPFAADSPFNTPIAEEVQVDRRSSTLVGAATADGMLHAGLIEFGIPIYRATADTPRYTVPCTVEHDWGSCPFDGVSVPIPDDARPQTGSDGAMVIVDEEARLSYEFWQAVPTDDGWTTTFGAVNDLDGSGWGGAATGSGASRLAGIVRVAEIERGEIPHALAIQSDNICAEVFRAPALKTDGRSTRSDCLPEGALLRLDPRVDLDALDLTTAQRAVAVAMQRYGGYVMDISGAPLSVAFERAPDSGDTSPGSVYEAAGLRWDYDGMQDVPWDRLQIIV